MDNKKAKQMIASGYDDAALRVGYWCQHQKNLIDCARFMRGEFLWWPKCGEISLTATQLKGVK
jgi:hypothetical protein